MRQYNAPLGGIPLIINAALEGNSGVQTLTIRPSAGRIWILLWLSATHTDNAAVRELRYFIDDNVIATTPGWTDAATIAYNTRMFFYNTNVPVLQPLVLEYSKLNIILQSTGVTAGKYFGYDGLVLEYKGNLARSS